MDSQESNPLPARSGDLVLRTFALLVGVVLAVIGVVGLAADWFGVGAAVRGMSLGVGTGGFAAALVIGVVVAFWGVGRRRTARPMSEEALSALVERYEREGNTEELAHAREQLIQLLIEKDENKDRQEPA